MTPLLELQTFTPPDTEMHRRPDGTIVLSSRIHLPDPEPSITAVLRKRAAQHPERPLAAQRDGENGWTTLTYAEALRKAGVEVSEREYPGMLHGFFGLDMVWDESREAMEFAAARLNAALTPPRR